jgi:glucosyl-dolichyl phosphate glucuronosyltransferase
MDVTVAICTWNRAGLLNKTLEHMKGLEIPTGIAWEVLVVNNNSTDDTDSVIARHQESLPLRRLFESKQGHCNARNTAVAGARGELVLWTDDDVLVDKRWLAALVEAAVRYPRAQGFGGPIEPWFPVPPDPEYLAAFPALRVGFCGLDHSLPEGIIETQQIFGANMAFRRRVHVNHKFDPAIGMRPKKIGSRRNRTDLAVGGGDEVELVQKLRAAGAQIVWIPTMRVKHYVDPRRMTFDYLRFHTVDLAQQSVRWQGIPPGKQFLGVPRWLLREWFEVTGAYWYNRLRRNHRTALAQKYRQWQLTGVIKGCFAKSDETRRSRSANGKPGVSSELSDRGN